MNRRARLFLAPVVALAFVALLVSGVSPPAAGFPTRTVYDRSLSAPGIGPIAVGDLNRDGLPDVVAVDEATGSYAIFLQTPTGLSMVPTYTFQGLAARKLLIADMGGDGAPDLIAMGSNYTGIFTQENGTFVQQMTPVPTGAVTDIAVADLNRNQDSAKDIAALAPEGLEIWFQNATTHRWSSQADLNISASGYNDLEAADLGGDGAPDLVLAKPFALLVYPQTATGLDFNRNPQVLQNFNGVVTLAVADVTGDSKPDIVFSTVDGTTGYGELSVYAQGDGTFNQTGKVTGAFTGPIAVGDLNDDGVPDLAAATYDGATSTERIAVFPQRFTGGFDLAPAFQLSVGTPSGGGFAVGRFSGRAFSDLIVRVDGAILVFQQEDLPPVLIQAIPSDFSFNTGSSGAGLIDLRNYFADDHGILLFRVEYQENPGFLYAMIAPDGHHLDFTSGAGWYGKARFQVSATDGVAGHTKVMSNIFSVMVNALPRVTSTPPAQVRVGQRFLYQVAVADPYPLDDVHTFSLVEAPQGMTIDTTTGFVEWTPTASDVGAQAVRVRVADAHGGSADQAFSVDVVAAPPPPPMAAILFLTVLGSIAALGASSLASENVKWSLLMFFLPLYSKIKREQVLDHFVRGQIYGYVLANPGEHYNAIKVALNLTNGSLAHHLKTLEREHFIKSKRFGLYRRFYPMNMKIPEDGFFTPNEIQKTVVDLIRSTPGITQKEIAERLGLTPPTVNYHVGILSEHRAIRVERAGRKTHCFVIEGTPGAGGSTSSGGPATPGPSAPRPPM